MSMTALREMVRATNLDEFFYDELANERNGGITPSTLGSACDSLSQAPDDILDHWLGTGNDGRHAAVAFAHLLWILGENTELRDLLDR